MSVNDVTDQLSAVLIDENNVNVIALDESFEAVFNLTYSCICGLIKFLIIDPVDKLKWIILLLSTTMKFA
jgi:hypothetical protein